jgi:4-diphosphocytidyl-2-C-methyl-D-erythritol kinase
MRSRAEMSAATRRVVVSAPAKINLSLEIVGRRTDGYHLLDSKVVPIDIFDGVEVRVSPARFGSVSLLCRPLIDVSDVENLATRAAGLFVRRTGKVCKVEITICKEIPVGAGLGGGSSDAAAVLKALNAIYQEEFPPSQVAEWGLELGADVPFFLLGRPARVQGVGERLSPLTDWPSSPLVVAFPGHGLSTAEVYRAYDDSLTIGYPHGKRPVSIREAPQPGQGDLNHLEAIAFQLRPELENVRGRLLALGACRTSMTGSGTAIFGFWRSWDDATRAAERMRDDGFWARAARVLPRSPRAMIG